jgi:hypothetical protein
VTNARLRQPIGIIRNDFAYEDEGMAMAGAPQQMTLSPDHVAGRRHMLHFKVRGSDLCCFLLGALQCVFVGLRPFCAALGIGKHAK